MYIILSLFILLLALLITIWLIIKQKKSTVKTTIKSIESEQKILQKPSIEFISKEYFEYIVDNAQYFNRMNQLDLIARDISNINSYKKLYKDGYKDFTDVEKDLLISLTNTLNESLKQTPKLYSIPWKFAKIDFNLEKGFPHTHSDTIVLSNNFFALEEKSMIETLLHEKIHVYQRLYPLQTYNLISSWNISVIDRIENYKQARNNPDINNFIYAYKDKAFLQIYNSDHPKDISDSTVVYYNPPDNNEKHAITKHDLNIPEVVTQFEHPYEIMATLIPKIILYNYQEPSNFMNSTMEWIKTNL